MTVVVSNKKPPGPSKNKSKRPGTIVKPSLFSK